MATCDLGYEHADAVAAEPEPVVAVPSGPNENEVRIAEVEAAAGIKVAQIEAGAVDDDLRAEVERLRGQVSGMQTVLDRIAPEPEPAPEPAAPAPVVVEASPEPEGTATPPEHKPEHSGGKSGGWWGSYT